MSGGNPCAVGYDDFITGSDVYRHKAHQQSHATARGSDNVWNAEHFSECLLELLSYFALTDMFVMNGISNTINFCLTEFRSPPDYFFHFNNSIRKERQGFMRAARSGHPRSRARPDDERIYPAVAHPAHLTIGLARNGCIRRGGGRLHTILNSGSGMMKWPP